MAKPTPAGLRLRDGHPCYVRFASTPNVSLWPISITPPGLERGGPNDTTTMLNDNMRTRQPKHLWSMSDGSFTAAYDPQFYDQVLAMNTGAPDWGLDQMEVTFSDGSTLELWGWLDSVVPNEVNEGEQPTVECVFISSNEDNLGNEVTPDYTAPP